MMPMSHSYGTGEKLTNKNIPSFSTLGAFFKFRRTFLTIYPVGGFFDFTQTKNAPKMEKVCLINNIFIVIVL